MDSDYIIRHFDTLKSAKHYYVIVEFCNGSDLETLLKSKLKLNERQVRYLYRQVLLGMRELCQKGVIHRDIKNANILVNINKESIVNDA